MTPALPSPRRPVRHSVMEVAVPIAQQGNAQPTRLLFAVAEETTMRGIVYAS